MTPRLLETPNRRIQPTLAATDALETDLYILRDQLLAPSGNPDARQWKPSA
jgi:hypothetical protein